MIWLGILIGLVVGIVVGSIVYHFFFKKQVEIRIKAFNDLALKEYEQEQLEKLHERIKEQENSARKNVHERAEHEYKTLTANYQTLHTLAASEQIKVDRLKNQQLALTTELENYRSALGRLFKAALDKEDRAYKLEVEKLRLWYAGMQDTYQQLLAADEANKLNIESEIQELSDHCKALASHYNELVNGSEQGYRIKMSEQAIFELTELWKAIKGLRLNNPAPLFKACFEMYVRSPLKEALSGLTPGGGIYCITDTTTNLCYVGRTTCFKDRWTTHIKRGSFYEEGTAVGSTLYTAMKEHGIWNFKFEILEVVEDEEKLGEYEKKWVSELDTVKNGLNMKAGG